MHRFKFETARFAEWLERISGPFPNEFTHFLDRKIGREVLFGDEAQCGFSLREDCVRGAKANAIQQSIGVQQRLRFFQRALERVNDPCRAFADELAVRVSRLRISARSNSLLLRARCVTQVVATEADPPTSDPRTPAIAVMIAVSITSDLVRRMPLRTSIPMADLQIELCHQMARQAPDSRHAELYLQQRCRGVHGANLSVRRVEITIRSAPCFAAAS